MNPDTSVRMSFTLGIFADRIKARVEKWKAQEITKRIWSKDFRVWSESNRPEITDRLGWLDLPETMEQHIGEITRAAEAVRDDNFERIVLLGMGGSSLAPQVFHDVFGKQPDWPDLIVLDTTHPAEIKRVEMLLDPERTVFIVASKSGTTQETISLFKYFFHRLAGQTSHPGSHFVAITDPATPLERIAGESRFRYLFHAPSDVGGRYSALCQFGLVPAAFTGIDIGTILKRAAVAARTCSPGVSIEANPGAYLGAVLGELAVEGIDKVTLVTDTALRVFPDWIEQLIAESTGKDGKGIVPVTGEPLDQSIDYGSDRFFVGIWLENGDQSSGPLETTLNHLARAGHPVCMLRLADRYDLAGHIYVWEFAVAAACSALGVNAFDQPDVQLAKDLARKAITEGSEITMVEDEILFASTPKADVEAALESLMASARSNDYFGIQAYLERNDSITSLLAVLRQRIGRRLKIATTLGFGPRFLHSSGQLHKGGPDTGIFLQLVDQPTVDLAIPESDFTFGNLICAQAIGDYLALKERSRRVLRIDLGSDPVASLQDLIEMI